AVDATPQPRRRAAEARGVVARRARSRPRLLPEVPGPLPRPRRPPRPDPLAALPAVAAARPPRPRPGLVRRDLQRRPPRSRLRHPGGRRPAPAGAGPPD